MHNHPETTYMMMPVTVVSRVRKFLAQILAAALVFITTINLPGLEHQLDQALVTTIPAVLAAIGVLIVRNGPQHPSSKFAMSILGAVGTFLTFVVQHGSAHWREAGLTCAAAVIGAAILWLTPNAGQNFTDVR